MPAIYKGFDPDLGAKFLGESEGMVIGLGRAAPRLPANEWDEDPYEMLGLDAQQQHDLMMEQRRALASTTPEASAKAKAV